MLAEGVETVPLLPRRRLLGSTFGGFSSIRRGEGTDIASSRPYEPGDHFRTIDWKSSARLSAAHGSDEFIVRERYSEEMSRVVIVVDRRPGMALYPRDLPWLHKPAAVAAAADLITASALNQRGLVGYIDGASHGRDPAEVGPFWQAPRSQSGAWSRDLRDQIAEASSRATSTRRQTRSSRRSTFSSPFAPLSRSAPSSSYSRTSSHRSRRPPGSGRSSRAGT